jgi:hypothetical protein
MKKKFTTEHTENTEIGTEKIYIFGVWGFPTSARTSVFSVFSVVDKWGAQGASPAV